MICDDIYNQEIHGLGSIREAAPHALAQALGGATATGDKSRDEWETPEPLFAKLHAHFDFQLDAAASYKNAKCEFFYTAERSGLEQPWAPLRTWVNPPYSEWGRWAAKAIQEASAGAPVVLLIPPRTDTKDWHQYARKADQIVQIEGRIQFWKSGAPAPKRINKHGKLERPSNSTPSVLLLFGWPRAKHWPGPWWPPITGWKP